MGISHTKKVQRGSKYTISVVLTLKMAKFSKIPEFSENKSKKFTELFELDSDGYIVNWTDEQNYILQDGGIKTSQKIGLNETEWKQIQVQKTIKFSNTAGLSVRFENHKAGSTIYWDDVSLRKNLANTDATTDAFNYELFVKK